MAKADTYRTGLQSARAFMGQWCAMETRPNRDPLLSQLHGQFLTILFWYKGNRSTLIFPEKHMKTQFF